MKGRCMKCKKMVEIKNGKEVKAGKRKTRMLKGKCKCGTTVCRILPKKK